MNVYDTHNGVCLMLVLFVSKINISPRINIFLKDTIKFKYVFSCMFFIKKKKTANAFN